MIVYRICEDCPTCGAVFALQTELHEADPTKTKKCFRCKTEHEVELQTPCEYTLTEKIEEKEEEE